MNRTALRSLLPRRWLIRGSSWLISGSLLQDRSLQLRGSARGTSLIHTGRLAGRLSRCGGCLGNCRFEGLASRIGLTILLGAGRIRLLDRLIAISICSQSEVAVPAYPGKGRPYPYFKVQFLDHRSMAWKDHRKEAFPDEVSARTYRDSIDPKVTTRIMRWDEDGAVPIGGLA